MSEEFIDNYREEVPRKRPVFLTVLCILTFISCGLAFLTAIYSLSTSDQTRQTMAQMEQIETSANGTAGEIVRGLVDNYEAIERWTIIQNYLSLANCAFCLVGALLMWKLRKPGYFIYCFGQVVPFVALYGNLSVMKDIPYMGIITVAGALFSVFFAIAFIVMYGLNLKHMR